MKKLIGFEIQSGEILSKDTGEVIPWSNCLLRCISDDDLKDTEFGYTIAEQKLKTTFVCKSLGLAPDVKREVVITELGNVLGNQIDFTIGSVKGKYEINGFTVIKSNKKGGDNDVK